MASRCRPIACAFYLTLFLLPTGARSGTDEVFKGVISDSQCAFKIHGKNQSHDEMLKTHKVGTTEGDCVWGCVTHFGGVFVLQSPDKVYRLDKQNLDRSLAAQQVEVRGELNPDTDTIHVLSIALAPQPDKKPLTSH
jgi:Protein of unknown function (DUF5818)